MELFGRLPAWLGAPTAVAIACNGAAALVRISCLSPPLSPPPLAKAMCLKLPALLLFVPGGGKSEANAQVPVE